MLSIVSIRIRSTCPSCFNSDDLVEGFGGLPNLGVHGGRVALVQLLAVLPKVQTLLILLKKKTCFNGNSVMTG